MTAVEILTEAKALVAGGWTQREFARNGYGNMVHFAHSKACQWCAVGALQRAEGKEHDLSTVHYLKVAAGLGESERLVEWNDAPERTQADVLAAFDRAIASAGGER